MMSLPTHVLYVRVQLPTATIQKQTSNLPVYRLQTSGIRGNDETLRISFRREDDIAFIYRMPQRKVNQSIYCSESGPYCIMPPYQTHSITHSQRGGKIFLQQQCSIPPYSSSGSSSIPSASRRLLASSNAQVCIEVSGLKA